MSHISERKRDGVFVQLLQRIQKRSDTGAVIFPVRAEHAGEAFFTVEGDPRKLSAVIVEESGRQAHSAPGGDICKRGIVVRTVEIVDLSGTDHPVLDSL